MKGSYTAIITPFIETKVDYEGLGKLVDFQIENKITGVLAVGTTGESPTLTWEEHNKVIEVVAEKTKNKCKCIAGTGSNNTEESLRGSKHAVEVGADALLLVDPYYNGPSSLEIRKEYVGPIAEACPGVDIIPYVVPGRTGAKLLPEDLATLYNQYPNVATVKEATVDFENMKKTRQCCGPDFDILSGDDPITYEMMVDPQIKATGVVSVVSNVAPGPVAEMIELLLRGDRAEGEKLASDLLPLFNMVTVVTTEKTPYGDSVCKARNPLAIKTLMAILGMPSGGLRRPLGKMTKAGVEEVLIAARNVQASNSSIFQPVADFFGVDVEDRLNNPKNLEMLCYQDI
ncbi:4-hydroxy-tetrahydrodipicolinate synthase [Thermodesulfobacteriota bacterium]